MPRDSRQTMPLGFKADFCTSLGWTKTHVEKVYTE